MADVNRGNRPLSPHLEIYRPQWTMVLSISHRITGVGLTLGALLVVWWLVAAATGPAYFALVDGLLTSWVGLVVLLGSAFALCYHTANGIPSHPHAKHTRAGRRNRTGADRDARRVQPFLFRQYDVRRAIFDTGHHPHSPTQS